MSPLPFSIHGPDRDVEFPDDSISRTEISSSFIHQHSYPGTNDILREPKSKINDRAQLIQKIKAGEVQNWNPIRSVGLTSGAEERNVAVSDDNLTQDFHHRFPIDDDNDRPQSALHSGVFADDSGRNLNHPPTPIATNFDVSFLNAFRSDNHSSPSSPPFGAHRCQINVAGPDACGFMTPTPLRLRGSSLSSFVFKIPTSPLVHSSNPDHMETESTSPRSSAPDRIHTNNNPQLPALPSSLSPLQISPSTQIASNFRNYSLSYKRRSVPDTYIDGPPNRCPPRRLSSGFGASSDLPFGSFVGSYEESILNGRMSTTPSRPLMFVAKIGVLGMGKCKPALKCPTHVTIPFPAYFYSVGDYDSPSPYVGQIDLEALAEKSNKKFPYGGYRIPQQGQLQIIIKNPNKTAVKLFLVPYDLRDMEPGSKTFIRQKSYAPGNAFLDEIIPATEKRKVRSRDRESLRYLIHLHICCPSRGRYYLYRNIRVVFANRVPDGKEKLRNEVLLPSPKYSTWKPGKETTSSSSSISSIGRKRSQSLHGSIGDHFGRIQARGFTGEDHREMPPPMPALPPQYMNLHNTGLDGSMSSTTAPLTIHIPKKEARSYDKIPASVYSSSAKPEAQGLLARKLKGLDVEGQE